MRTKNILIAVLTAAMAVLLFLGVCFAVRARAEEPAEDAAEYFNIYKDSYGDNEVNWQTMPGILAEVGGAAQGEKALALDCTTNPNTEFYIDFGRELDLSDTNADYADFFDIASLEFEIKVMDTPGGFFNVYLFMEKEGVYGTSAPVNEWYYRSTAQLSKYIDAGKLGQWQHVQIPVSAFSSSADTVADGQKVTGAAVMDFSKVRAIGFAHMFGTNSTYVPSVRPTVYYDDIKIMVNNLPDPYLGCKMVQYSEFSDLDAEFTTIDLRPYATTGYTGGSGIGWTNQGSDNELTGFDLTGNQVFNNVPFDIIDQAQNNNKSVIGLRSRKASESPLFTESVTIPIGRKADGAYMIHNMSWEDKTVARYTWIYDDGTQEAVDIINGRHIFNWWKEEQSDVCPIIWRGNNAEASAMSLPIKLNMFAFKNPQPGKTIASLKFEIVSETAADMIVALTLADFAGTDDFYMCFTENPYNPDTTDWYAYELADLEQLVGSTLDVSYLLDARDHGYVRTEGDDFVFEDGTKVKFWGTNVSGKLIFSKEDNKETLELLVDVLAACGYNLVRIMDWDASFYYPNIFGNASGWDGVTVSAQQLDQFNYFWSLCKEKGIYIQFCMVGGRTAATDMVDGKLTDDEVADIGTGLKFELYIDDRLEEGTKDVLRTVMGTENEYTGTTLAQDRILAMTEIANESNLTSLYGVYISNTSYEFVSDAYKTLFREKFNAFLTEKYKTTQALYEAWKETGKSGLDSRTEKLEEGSVKIDQRYLQSNYSAQRCADTFEFLYTLQIGFYNRMAEWAKSPVEDGGLGLKSIITGTQNLSLSDRNDLFLNAHFDYIARHSYQSHPTTGTEYNVGTATGNSQSMIPGWTGNSLAQAGYRKVIGIPYIVNEMNEAEPNVHTAEFNLLAAAIFSYQGWSATNFTFGTRSLDSRNVNIIDNSFAYLDNPTRFSTIASSSLLYFRNEITGAETGYYRMLTVDDSMQYNEQSLGLPDGTYIVGKTGIYFADEEGTVLFFDESVDVDFESDVSILEKIRHSLLTSEGGEIIWTTKDRQFLLNTPWTQAVIGEVAGETHRFRDVEITTSTEFVNITVSALGKDKNENVALGRTLADADRILVTAVARARNKGQELNSDGTTITKYGTSPIIVEQVEGTIVIKSFDTFEAYILNSSGQRIGQATLTKDERGYTVLTMRKGDDTTYYELVRVEISEEKPDLGTYKDVDGDLRTIVEEMAAALPAVTQELYLPEELTERGDFIGGVVRALSLTSDNTRAYADADSNHQAYEEFKIARGLELVAGLQINAYEYITKADAYYALCVGLAAKGIRMTTDSAALSEIAGFAELSDAQKEAVAGLVSVKVLDFAALEETGVGGYLTRGDAVNLLYAAKYAQDADTSGGTDGPAPADENNAWLITVICIGVCAAAGGTISAVLYITRKRKQS